MSEPGVVVPDHVLVSRLLSETLETVIEQFAIAGVSLPSRQYISVSQTVHDCEQVTVQLDQVYNGSPGDQAQTPSRCNGPRSAVMVIQVVRCVPEAGRAPYPPVDAMNAYADSRAQDAWLLLESGLLVGNDYLGALVDVTTNPAEGNMQAVVATVVVGIDNRYF